MVNRRFHLAGLIAVLLALMAQTVAGGSVPAMDSLAGVSAICHTGDGAPPPPPGHPVDCPVCPLCIAMHVSPVMVASADAIMAPSGNWMVVRSGLPPPSTAPPVLHRPPSQPRAPPLIR